MKRFSEKRQLGLLLAVAFALRFAYILTRRAGFYFGDEPLYHRMAENFLAGLGLNYGPQFQAFRPPLFPLITAVIHAFGGGLTAVRTVNVLFSTATVYLVYQLGRELFAGRVGLLAAAGCAFWPFFIYYNGLYLTEPLYVFLTVAFTLYFSRLLRSEVKTGQPGDPAGTPPETVIGKTGRGYRDGWLGGFLFGLSLLCRPTLLVFFPFALAITWLAGRRTGPVLIAALACALTVTPWVIRNRIVMGAFVPGTTMGGRVFYEGNNPHADGGPCHFFPAETENLPELERDRAYYRLTLGIIRANPDRFFGLAFRKFRRFWSLTPNAAAFQGGFYRLASLLALVPALVFFLVGTAYELKRPRTLMLTSQIVFQTVFHMVFLGSIRYRLPVEPFVIILAAAGFLRCRKRLFPGRPSAGQVARGAEG